MRLVKLCNQNVFPEQFVVLEGIYYYCPLKQTKLKSKLLTSQKSILLKHLEIPKASSKRTFTPVLK